MANGADSRVAVGATAIRDSRPRTMIASAKDPSGDPLSRWLILIPVGCLLIAMVGAAALSLFGSTTAITSSTAPIDQGTVIDVPTFHEVEGGESLLRFGPAMAR